MKLPKKIYIYYQKYHWEGTGEYIVYSFKAGDSDTITFICEQDVELEIPDNYDPRAQQIQALEKQKLIAMADYQKSVSEINDRISKLQALEYTA
jgi:hypothetical protein